MGKEKQQSQGMNVFDYVLIAIGCAVVMSQVLA